MFDEWLKTGPTYSPLVRLSLIGLAIVLLNSICQTHVSFAQSLPSQQLRITNELSVHSFRLVPPSVEFLPVGDFDPASDRVVCALDAEILDVVGLPTPVENSARYSISLKIPASFDKTASPRVWQIRRNALALLASTWPSEASLHSIIDSTGPGGDSAWVRAGANAGIRVGNTWWRRVGGQPHMRLDVRFVSDDLCYCRCVRLAAGAAVVGGDAVELWPSPADSREGRLRTAVSFIDSGQDDPFVWLPRIAPRTCPADARFDFYRAGQYVGFGVAERSDDRFWYVRLLKQACTGPVQVGDDAVARTFQDAAAGRVRARVFANSKEGWLVTAGESEGLKPSHAGVVFRDNRPIGTVEVRRVQEAYCTTGELIAPRNDPGDSPSAERRTLRVLDEVRFGNAERLGVRVGWIRGISSGGFVSVTLEGKAPMGLPLCVQARGRTIGVVALFDAGEKNALGAVFEQSPLEPLEIGLELWSR